WSGHSDRRPAMAATIDTGSPHIRYRAEGHVATITFDRPERRNAVSMEMLAALEVALDAADRDDGGRAVVLTGAGNAFCAGGDVKGMDENLRSGRGGEAMSIDAAITWQRRNQRNTSGRIYTMPKPVIASIPGAAAGAGVSFALACDLRIASENAVFT